MARAALAVLLSLLTAGPALAADIAQGEKIARRWCAACHVVAADQTQASVAVPTFFNVAQRKSGQQLTTFLTDPHPKMPDMSLTREEIADIVGYIESLKP
jgi:mono/diheme cytochrome c family protein